MVGVGILRVQLDGASELCLGSRPVPVEIHFDIASDVCASESVASIFKASSAAFLALGEASRARK